MDGWMDGWRGLEGRKEGTGRNKRTGWTDRKKEGRKKLRKERTNKQTNEGREEEMEEKEQTKGLDGRTYGQK